MNSEKTITVKEVLKNRILWRVYLAWFFRRIVPLIVVQVLVFLGVLKIFARNVFISKVFHNAANVADFGYWAFLKYSFFAFFNARPITQLAILMIFGIMALLLRDLIRVIMAYKGMWIRKPGM